MDSDGIRISAWMSLKIFDLPCSPECSEPVDMAHLFLLRASTHHLALEDITQASHETMCLL